MKIRMNKTAINQINNIIIPEILKMVDEQGELEMIDEQNQVHYVNSEADLLKVIECANIVSIRNGQGETIPVPEYDGIQIRLYHFKGGK